MLTNLNSVIVHREPCLYNELANKNNVDASIGNGNIIRFNQTLQVFVKVSVGNDIYNFTKYGRRQITDITNIKNPTHGGCISQQWIFGRNDKKGNCKTNSFIKSSISSTRTGSNSGTKLPL